MKPGLENSSVTAKSIQIYRLLTDALEQEKVEFFTFATQKVRAQTFVIRGLAITTDPDDIATELAEIGFTTRSVKQLTVSDHGQTARKIPLFQVTLAPTVGKPPADLTSIKRLQHCVVTTEPPRTKKDSVIQCFRCQRVGHTSEFCRQKLRCVRCGLEHGKEDCSTPRDQPTCCNCKVEGHAACYRGCETMKKAVRSKKAATKHSPSSTWQAAAEQRRGQRPTPRLRLEVPATRPVLSSRLNEREELPPGREAPHDLSQAHPGSWRQTATPNNSTYANVTSGASPSQTRSSTPTNFSNMEQPTIPTDNPLDWKQLLLSLANMLATANLHPILTQLALLVPTLISLIPAQHASTK